MKTYLALKENKLGCTDLEVSLSYNMGGTNYFTGNVEQRGYYLSVSPVTRKNGCISYTAFSGTKMCIKAVSRRSTKAEKEAYDLIPQYLDHLSEVVLQKNNLSLED